MKLEGKLFTGMKAAQDYLSMKEYQEKIKDKTGFKPFPGTLNLKADKEQVKKLEKKTKKKRINSFQVKDKKYSGLTLYPVKINGLKAHYIDIDITDYGKDVIELIAPEKLREKLGLEDGDQVEVTGL